MDTRSPLRSPLVELVEHAARDADFWFDDGNLIMLTTPPTVAFRVFKGLLAAQSEVFTDMFVGSSSLDAESFEGSPIVQLSDSPQDFRHLLKILLPMKTRLQYCSHGEITKQVDLLHSSLWTLSAVIRLSHKYQIPELLKQSMSCLRKGYGRGLTDGHLWHSLRTSPDARITDTAAMIEVIELARLTDTPFLLPLAFYHCVTGISPSTLADGWVREDGTVIRLGMDDMRRCLEGQRSLCGETANRIVLMFTIAQDFDCTTAPQCRDAVAAFCGDERGAKFANTVVAGAMKYSWSLIDDNVPYVWPVAHSKKAELCEACASMIKKGERIHRRHIWSCLPKFFDLEVPGWEELVNDPRYQFDGL